MASELSLFLASSLLVVFLLYRIWRNARDFWPSRGVPFLNIPGGYKAILIGNIEFETKAYRHLLEKGQGYGGFLEFWNPVLLVKDLDLVKQICVKDFHHFVDHRTFNFSSDPLINHGLFFSSGDDWKALRSTMSPAFSSGKIKDMFGIFNKSAQNLVQALHKYTVDRQSSEVEIESFHKRALMEMILSAALGVQAHLFEDTSGLLYDMCTRFTQGFGKRSQFKFIISIMFPQLSYLLPLRLTDETAALYLTNIVSQVVEKRRKGERRNDFIQIMLDALEAENSNSSKLLSDDVIFAQCLTFIIGGYDTVESLLLWATHVLATQLDIQDKLYAEVKAVNDADGGFSPDNINSMPYMDAFLQETLRVYPSFTRQERKCVKAYKLPGTQVIIPEGTIVAIPFWNIHMDSDIWENPHEFRPERFYKENSIDRHPCAFLTFGVGPRFCIGNRFALFQAKAILANLILNFQIRPNNKTISASSYGLNNIFKPLELWIDALPRK